MKKARFTRNDLTGRPVIKICYCGAYELLRGLEPVGYMSGVYGWNCDIYDAGAAWIVTGYRMPVNGVYPDWDLLKAADKAAAQAYKADWLEYSERLEYIAGIRAEFVRYTLVTEAI